MASAFGPRLWRRSTHSVPAARSLGRRMTWHAATALVASGPFAISRNPIYLANGLLLLGLGGLFDNAWFFVAAPVAAFATDRLAIRREERHLTALFGPAWSAYADRVDRWFGRRMPSQSP